MCKFLLSVNESGLIHEVADKLVYNLDVPHLVPFSRHRRWSDACVGNLMRTLSIRGTGLGRGS